MPKATVRPYYEQTSKAWAELFDRLRTAGPNARILLKGATVISVDAAIGDFDQGDVLIRGRRIEAVDTDLSAVAVDGGAIVIEMGGMIVMPGIVDGHRHCWLKSTKLNNCALQNSTIMKSTPVRGFRRDNV
jgi:predicted amidohydrolase